MSIMDYGSDGGGEEGGGRRRESFTGESSDLDFLHRQQEESLIPLKEDLADWLNRLLGIEIGVEDFMDVLDSGVHVCKLAKLIQARAEEAVAAGTSNEHVPKTRLRYKENARSGTWFARDNVANFIRWCREYGVKEECLFETEGLVSHTTPRNFILCLLELGRMAYKYDMDAPCLVAMEKEIDRLEQGSFNGDSIISGVWSPEPPVFESPPPPPSPLRQSRIKSPTQSKSPPHDKLPAHNKQTESNFDSPGRESRIPLRKSSSTSSTMSNGTHHSSPSPSSANRRSLTGDSASGSPRGGSRSPGRGGSRSPARCGSQSPGRNRNSMVDNGVMTMKDSQDMVPRSASTLSDQSTGGRDVATSTLGSPSVSVGTTAFLSVQSTGTCTDNSSRPSSRNSSRSPTRSSIPVSTMPFAAASNGTEMADSSTGRRSRSASPWFVSNGTMTSAVDTRVNAGINTDSPRSDTASTSPDTPRRSVWRRSVSPSHGTRIPVPVGTSAHGMLTHGVSTSSLSSVGSNNTPTQLRRRSSMISTPDDNTPNMRRRRSSMISNNGDTHSSNTRRRSSIASTNGDTPNTSRRRSSIISSNGDTPRPGSGTKTPRRRSMSAKSDRSDELDKEVRRISGRCECPQCYQIDRLSEGKYRIGDRVVFVRITRDDYMADHELTWAKYRHEVRSIECRYYAQVNKWFAMLSFHLLKGKHVMVRVGGGWDTLDHYLATHDPCRVMEVRREPSNSSQNPWGAHHQLTAADDKFLFAHGKYKAS